MIYHTIINIAIIHYTNILQSASQAIALHSPIIPDFPETCKLEKDVILGMHQAGLATPVSVHKTFLLGEHLPCNTAAETPLQPLIWHSESLSSHVVCSPEVFLFLVHRHR